MITPLVVGVRFKPAGRIFFFTAGAGEIEVGDAVVVPSERGPEIGRVVIAPRQVISFENQEPLPAVLRPATPEDCAQAERFRRREKEAISLTKQKAAARGLPMKITGADYTLDGSRLTIYFTADHRIDFRELVRDLAAQFRTRIELRQVGARDGAKMIGGVGVCGRQLCCSSFLHDYPSVSMKAAKLQNLSLNPEKITGACGRLLCCIAYEADTYLAAAQRMPRVGQSVQTEHGPGRAIGLDVFEETVRVLFPDGQTLDLPLASLILPAHRPAVAPSAQ